MREDHIIRMLEEKPFGSLSEGEIASAQSHADNCPECRSAYEAARLSAVLIRERAAEEIEVSPFFKTRVMAAIRERQLSAEAPALVRMWRSAAALVSTMAVIVVVLAGMTFFSYSDEPVQIAGSESIYSPEYVVFERGDPVDDGLAYDQVLATMYDSEEAYEK